tara:strand:+ start:31 stop:291 length:261 start_codon:yes stop_codon:yes gene_type:complete
MVASNNREVLLQVFDNFEIVTADGFDDAILGMDEPSGRVIYSSKKCIEILMEDDMTEAEALEYFHYNVCSAYVGESTPIWCCDLYL